jgi:FecR protein
LQPKIDFASLRERTTTIDDDRASALQARVLHRHARHVARVRVARMGGVALLAIAPVIALVIFLVQRRPSEVPVAAAPPVRSVAPPSGGFGGLVLPDGSRVTFLAPGTELAQSGTQGRQSTLVRGAARFDVVHDASTPFRVTAGGVVVEDLGTVFTVRLDDDRATFVNVESGSVSVRGAQGARVLEAGASQSFPVAPVPSVEPSALPSASTSAHAPPPRAPSWKKLAQTGEYARAYATMREESAVVRDDPDELLLAADAARFSGHADQAVPILRRLIDKFPSDSRAGLGAFTLGRVLLDDLGNAREAARAFAIAGARGGPLAEDALAREVEAWNRAGDRVAAKDAARRYLAAHPNGARAAFVRHVAEAP